MNLASIYQKKEDVIVRCIAGEILLIPVRSQLADMQKIFSLNTVAEFIWQQLDGKQSLKKIQEEVTANFEVTEKQVITDVQEYIKQLLEANIVEEIK